MPFTDQKQRIATEEHCKARWSFGKPGENFRCYFCGHKFKVGDLWRWVYSTKYCNFLVCSNCDGEDIKERWIKHNEEARQKFWWLMNNY